MNVTVKIFEGLPAMADHRPRERSHRFRRNFDRTRCEKLIVRDHKENVERPTLNVQCRIRKAKISILGVVLLYEADIAAALKARDFDF